ncbi:hypothetical protein Btru_069368 [Bulinus truncatus]|nr:hypothetical protein Btru_069368 [Bulinus truncatus]
MSHLPMSYFIDDTYMSHLPMSYVIDGTCLSHLLMSYVIDGTCLSHLPMSYFIDGTCLSHLPMSYVIDGTCMAHLPMSYVIDGTYMSHLPMSYVIDGTCMSHLPMSYLIDDTCMNVTTVIQGLEFYQVYRLTHPIPCCDPGEYAGGVWIVKFYKHLTSTLPADEMDARIPSQNKVQSARSNLVAAGAADDAVAAERDFPTNKNSNAGQEKPNGDKSPKSTPRSLRASSGEERMNLDVEDFIRRMVGEAQSRVMSPDEQDSNLDLDDLRRLVADAQNGAGPRDFSDLSTSSAEIPVYDSDTSDASARGRDSKVKKKKRKKMRFDPVHERRMLYRPSPFLTYIKPKDYVGIPANRNLPSYPHNALPFPWGVRLPLPKSQRNSPDLPVCSPLPLFPPENIMAFSYQHSSKHYQICADSKAEQKLEWL